MLSLSHMNPASASSRLSTGPSHTSSQSALSSAIAATQPLGVYKLPVAALSPRMSYKVGLCSRGSPRGLSAIALHLLHTEIVGHVASHSSAGHPSLFPEHIKGHQPPGEWQQSCPCASRLSVHRFLCFLAPMFLVARGGFFSLPGCQWSLSHITSVPFRLLQMDREYGQCQDMKRLALEAKRKNFTRWSWNNWEPT